MSGGIGLNDVAADMTATYRASFFRPRENWRDWVLRFRDIRIVYRQGEKDGFGELCRTMRAAGLPDGDLLVYEIGVKPGFGLNYYHSSFFQRGDVPAEEVLGQATVDADEQPATAGELQISHHAFETLRSLKNDPTIWAGVGGRSKGFLLANRLVEVTDDKTSAVVTEAGEAAMLEFETRPETAGDALVTPRQREALEIVVKRPLAWSNLHGKTRNFLVEKVRWVVLKSSPASHDRPILTEEGKKIATAIGLSL